MNLNDLLLMRHELLMTLLIVIILIAEIFAKGTDRSKYLKSYIILFTAFTLLGFFPMGKGSLFGEMYYSNPSMAMLKNILNIGALVILLQSYPWLQSVQNRNKSSEFYLLIISTLVGMDFMVSAGNFLMLYLGLELASIPVAILAAYEKKRNRSAEAGVKYIFMSALSSGILLYGISMLYGTTGTILFSEMAGKVTTDGLAILGLIFFITGMGFKISLVPFHLWTADVYEGSPISVTAYLSVVSKGAAVFIFMITLYRVFGNLVDVWEEVLYILAISTMTIGNLFAIRQTNIKRLLAFSSIAQAGFILLGLMGDSTQGMTSVVYFMLIYIFTNLGAFGVAATISHVYGKENIEDYKGLYRTNPLLSLLMMVALFSLAGIPPVAGFFGKFFLFMSAASKGYYILVLIAVLNATISLYYYLRVVKAMFIDKTDTPLAFFKSAPSFRISMVICLAGIVTVGFLSFIYQYILSGSALL